jgi:LytS/YehU family sensor histidine kinase
MVKGAWIKIRVTSTLNELIFEIENSRDQDDGKKEVDKAGLGLENIKRRLELLYPSKHTLRIIESQNKYSVFLTIIYNM